MELRTTMTAGDRMPPFAGVSIDRAFHSSDAQSGRPAVLVLGGTSLALVGQIAAALASMRAAIDRCGADVLLMFGFAALPALMRSDAESACGFRALLCADDFLACCGDGDRPTLVLIDRGGRIVRLWRTEDGDPDRLAGGVIEALTGLVREKSGTCVPSAPVLMVPGLLEGELCQELIERFETSDTFESGVSGTAADGGTRDRVDQDRKCRRDWLVDADAELHARVRALLVRRCLPELARAFQHEADRFDRILVARYDEGVGLFRGHRDNANQAVAFRQFALSVNLNAGEYEGGHLVFPEYSDHRYRPATGEGLVFSASLLHEATRVTRGRRYVLLTFIHDGSALSGRARCENQVRARKSLPGTLRAGPHPVGWGCEEAAAECATRGQVVGRRMTND